MNTLKLTRIKHGIYCTLGILTLNNARICFTLEPPWKNNLPFESCIPEYVYEIRPISESKIHVLNVPKRSEILIHIGNFHDQSEGCVLVGKRLDVHNHFLSVFESRAALTLLMKLIKDFNIKCLFVEKQLSYV
jgi:hypothetical protein